MTQQRPVDVLVRLLTERGPMTEDDLLAETDVDFDAALEQADGLLTMLADDRWGALTALLEGRMLTHRVTADELASDTLAQHPDLPVFGELVDTHERLADGTVLGTDFDGHLWLTFPAGYLRSLGVTEGSVVAFGLTADELRLEVIDEDALTEPANLGAALRATLETHGEPIELDTAVPSICADDPQVLRTPHAPFTELLPRLGFAVQDEWLAEEGFDFAARRVELQTSRIAELHRLEPHEARAVGALVDGYRDLADGRALGEPESLREVLGLLADPAVAAAVLAETIAGPSRDPAALRSLAETYEPRAPHAARVGLRWLRAKAIEHTGTAIEAEAELLAAEAIDPNWPPVLEDLARYASDRGDATRAIALSHRAGTESTDELLELLDPFESAPRADIGRNEPCWCGSGKKYKKCHLNNTEFPLPERAGWLYAKAARQIRDDHTHRMLDLAAIRSAHWDSDDRMFEALDDPLLENVLLFEAGVLEAFLEVRGALLPDDERLLAQQWLLGTRSVFEVTDIVTGQGFTARDTRTGEQHEVLERTGSRQLRNGVFICVRLLPVGDTVQIFGGIEPVSLTERDALIALLDADPGPEQLVEFLSHRFAPPQLLNTEGDPLTVCSATLRTGSSEVLRRTLDAHYSGARDEWHQLADDGQTLQATLRLESDTLTVETNSERRFDTLLRELTGHDGSLELVQESRTPPDQLPSDGHAPEPLDPSRPELAEALQQHIEAYEQRWLDEAIPALSGYTPRQAAHDPTRRDDLLRLLDTFPAADNPGMMNPQRLRAQLGLD